MNDRTLEGEEPVGVGRKTRLARYALLDAICALVIGLYALKAHSGWLELYSLNAENTYYNLLVRGFRAGQLNLEREVPSGLAQLSNPFDPKAMSPYLLGNYPLHDQSYYQGKLYLYFGVTPALVLFWPYAALTGHYLLHKEAVVVFFSMGFLASAALLWLVWRRFFAGLSVGVVAAGMLALGWANFAPVILQRCDVYEVAISCGYALTMVTLLLLWRAIHSTRGRCWWLAGAGLAYGLAVGARPSLLVGAVILLVPVALAWRERAGPGQRPQLWTQVMAPTVPILLIGLGLMLYNFLRFGDPWEFGQTYQLTQDRVSALQQFSLRYLWSNFRVGFLAPARWSGHFPFVHNIALPSLPSGGVVEQLPFGVLTNVPLVWLALAAPLAWRGLREGGRGALRGFVGAVALLFGSCALTLCLHNSMTLRYEVEFLPALVLLAVLGIFGLERALAGRRIWGRVVRWTWGLLLTFSVSFNWFAMSDRYVDNYIVLGMIPLDKGQVDEAIVQFQKALHLQPNNAEAHNNLGTALIRQGKVAEAIGHCKQAVRLNPGDAEAHNNLGAALVEQGNVREAISHCELALRLKPDSVEAHTNLGKALAQLGRVPEAIDHLEQALRLRSENAPTHAVLGTVLLEQGKVAEAIGHYEQSLRIQPDFAEVHNNLGLALVKQGNVGGAVSHYEQALRLSPNHARARFNLALALVQLGDIPAAMSQYQEALRLKPDYADAHKKLGAALLRQGKVAEAVGPLEQALRLKPDDAEVRMNLGIALFQQNQVVEAMGHLEQALRFKPDYADAHYNLGKALFQQGKVPEAISHYEQVLRLKPDDAEAQNQLAWVLATCEDGAVRNGARAVKLAEAVNRLTGGKDTTALDTLAAAYAEAGRFGDAVRTAQAVLELVKGAGQAEQAQQIEERLKLYQAGQPYRDGSAQKQ